MGKKLIMSILILLISILLVTPILAEGNRNGNGGPPSNSQPNDSAPPTNDSQSTDSGQLTDNRRPNDNGQRSGNGNHNSKDQQGNNHQPNSNGQQKIVILGQITSIGTDSITIQVLNGNVVGKSYIGYTITVSTTVVDFYQWTEEGCVLITDLETTLEEGALVNVHGSLNEDGEIVMHGFLVFFNA